MQDIKVYHIHVHVCWFHFILISSMCFFY